MIRPQDFSPLTREKRLIFSTPEPEPMEAPDATPPPAGTRGEQENTEAERAMDTFIGSATRTSAERTRDAVAEHIGETVHRNLEALQVKMEERKKTTIWGKTVGRLFGKKKTDNELFSEEFDDIARRAVADRNESMLHSENEALRRIAESTSKTGEEFMLLEHKCRSLRGYLAACRKQLEVYQSERARFERLSVSLRRGKNSIFAEEIARIQNTIENITHVLAQETAKARQSVEHKQVEEIRKQDTELRQLLIEENPGFFSGTNLTELIMEAVGGKPERLKDAIRLGVRDEEKLEIFLAATDNLVAAPIHGGLGRVWSWAREYIPYAKRGPEILQAEEERRRALAYHYTTQFVETTQKLRANTIDERLAALKNLPIGSQVELHITPAVSHQLTIAGKQVAPGGTKEYIILRSMLNDETVVAVDIEGKVATIRPDYRTQSMVVKLGIPEEYVDQNNDTVLYLSGMPPSVATRSASSRSVDAANEDPPILEPIPEEPPTPEPIQPEPTAREAPSPETDSPAPVPEQRSRRPHRHTGKRKNGKKKGGRKRRRRH